MFYCSAEHKGLDRDLHMAPCRTITGLRRKVQEEERRIRSIGEDEWAGRAFEMWIGPFDSFDEYKTYMNARLALRKAYGAMETKTSVALQRRSTLRWPGCIGTTLRSSTPSFQA
jgi:hypothetical protein